MTPFGNAINLRDEIERIQLISIIDGNPAPWLFLNLNSMILADSLFLLHLFYPLDSPSFNYEPLQLSPVTISYLLCSCQPVLIYSKCYGLSFQNSFFSLQTVSSYFLKHSPQTQGTPRWLSHPFTSISATSHALAPWTCSFLVLSFARKKPLFFHSLNHTPHPSLFTLLKSQLMVCPLWAFPALISRDFLLYFLRAILIHKLGHLTTQHILHYDLSWGNYAKIQHALCAIYSVERHTPRDQYMPIDLDAPLISPYQFPWQSRTLGSLWKLLPDPEAQFLMI